MARLKASERARIAFLSAERFRRSALSSVLYSPILRWQFGSGAARQLVIVPQDLRTADPSFWDEVKLGQFGLAGTVAIVGGETSPFDIEPPNKAWARALHGFEWLTHMDASGQPEAHAAACRLAAEWTLRHAGDGGIPWEPAVTGRRIISWISHAGILLEKADARTYEMITQSLGQQLVRLSASWRDSPDGYPRLLALAALVLADLSVSGRDNRLAEAESNFIAELTRQILPDGGHVSRNPGVLVDLMLDILPLHQCFTARGRTPPAALSAVMQAMLSMLKYMRLGDGMLARFNGVSIASPAGLATVLAYDNSPGAMPASARSSKYIRLERGSSIVIMDVGPPPPLEAASQAHAGCLSFEMSSGKQLLFVNGGAPGPADSDWHSASRATASHNALCLSEKSSSKLIRHKALEGLLGAAPIRYPEKVEARLEEHCGNLEAVTWHNGYERRFNLLHRRTLVLNSTGRRLLGIDRVDSPRRGLRLRQGIPFAIHFHLHPDTTCHRGSDARTVEIALPGGEVWRFSVEEAALTIEESTFFADSAGPRRALQIVLRGATMGETEVRWVVEACSA